MSVVNDSSPNEKISFVLISLMKGVSYREENPALWQSLIDLQARVREHIVLLGLELILDEAEGYAYLRQRTEPDDGVELPRLVPRRQLSYRVSLLLALLRKKLAEFDAVSGEARLVISQEDIVDMLRVFLPNTANEARLTDRIESDIRKIVEMGFLRRLRGQEDRYEVRRILKAFVDAQWLQEFERRLTEYRDFGLSSQIEGGKNIIDKF